MLRRAWAGLQLMAAAVGRARVAGLVGLQILVAVSEGAALILLVPVIQALDGGSELSVPGLDLDLSLAEAFGAVLVVVLLRAVGQWWSGVLAIDYRLATLDRLRLALVDDLYRSDWSYLSSQRRSHVVASLTTDVERAHVALSMLIRLLVGSLILMATAGVALLVSPTIGGLAVVAALVVVALASRSTRGATVLGRRMTDRMADFGAALSDSLNSVRVMRAHDAAAAWSDLVGGEAARVRDVRRRLVSRASMIAAVLGVVVVVAVLALILIGREVGMSLAELATLIVVATRLLSSTQNLLIAAQAFANDVPALERLSEFHAEIRLHPEHVATGPRRVPVTGTEDSEGRRDPSALLELVDVGVRYQDEASPVAALSGIGLAVPYRGLVVVLGPSGSGKSTLLDVVLGLLRPQEGAMLVDGRPVEDLGAWRARLGYVPQQTVLVPGTVWTNLAWSLQPGRALTEEAAWSALRTARLADLVASLPDGLQAPLSELAQLSGGEQQRLAIARALVREPELLILDEATSALDRETEGELLASLLDGSRAVLMVTHRPVPEGVEAQVLRLESGRAV